MIPELTLNLEEIKKFGIILGLTLKYFTVQIESPVNADILYEAINKDRDEKHKTGNIVSWSKIEE